MKSHPTAEQRAALERAKHPKKHPYRCWYPSSKEIRQTAEASEKIVPKIARLVRS